MSASDVERYMGSTLAALGFDLDEIDPDVVYGAGQPERAESTSCWPH